MPLLHCLPNACCLPGRSRRLPCVTVAYQGLSVETDAAVGAAGIPTVARWMGGDLLAAAGKALAGGGATARTVRLPILCNVQGALQPVSLAGLLLQSRRVAAGHECRGSRHFLVSFVCV